MHPPFYKAGYGPDYKVYSSHMTVTIQDVHLIMINGTAEIMVNVYQAVGVMVNLTAVIDLTMQVSCYIYHNVMLFMLYSIIIC